MNRSPLEPRKRRPHSISVRLNIGDLERIADALVLLPEHQSGKTFRKITDHRVALELARERYEKRWNRERP